MHRRRHHDPSLPPNERLGNPLARVALGATVAVALFSASASVFGPLADRSVHAPAAVPLVELAASLPSAQAAHRSDRGAP